MLHLAPPLVARTLGALQAKAEPSVVVLPPSNKHWRDDPVAWQRLQARTRITLARSGVPPVQKGRAVQGVNLQQALHDKYLQMQANVFALVDENRTLSKELSRLQHANEELIANLALARSQG